MTSLQGVFTPIPIVAWWLRPRFTYLALIACRIDPRLHSS